MGKRSLIALLTSLALIAAACSGGGDTVEKTTDDTAGVDESTETGTDESAGSVVTEDRAYYILPPGNYGGLPTNENSLDQMALYDGLTPLRGSVSDADIEQFYLAQNFEPIGATRVEETGRDGVTVTYDEWGIAHVVGDTREDVAFGAGWVTARDRGLLISLGRWAARAAVADIPGIDAFSLVTSLTPYEPSEQVEALVDAQVELLLETYGDEGAEVMADAQAYADGMNAYWGANNTDTDWVPFEAKEVIATTAFIGSIFGAGGGSEAANASFLASLEAELGPELGRSVWEDLMQTDDPEAPTTIDTRFEYGTYTGGDVTGSVMIDAGSVISLDPRNPDPDAAPNLLTSAYTVSAAGDPPDRKASNWLTVAPDASTNDTTLAVMGPQLGYYYPEIVMQIDLQGPGIKAQGAAVPGLAMYLLIGRTEDYAWSLTSANQDVRDVFAEVLCEPDGSTPTRQSTHYEFEGECVAFEAFDAGVLGGQAISYPVSVHGPVIGTATSDGAPVALTRQRSTFGRDGFNLVALKRMTEGQAETPEDFFEIANHFGFTFNWGYANRETNAYFASGLLPERAPGLDRRLPTLGTGEYEWQGFLAQDEHPHAISSDNGRLLNWNNQSAPGFMHGDGNLYGSWHRVENFDQWDEDATLAEVVSVMNRAATEDTAAPVWPVISEVLAAAEAPSALAAEALAMLDAWVADDAPLLDADEDGFWDDPSARIHQEIFDPLLFAAVEPVLGSVISAGVSLRGIGLTSLVDKDLRTLLGHSVEGEFANAYCGAGDLTTCAEALWASIDGQLQAAAAELGDDLTTWRRAGLMTSFVPGLIPDTFRSTNRPTYQQVLEFAPQRPVG